MCGVVFCSLQKHGFGRGCTLVITGHVGVFSECVVSVMLVFQMRHSKRMHSPDVWLDEYSWGERMEHRKRRRRDSHSSERENKSRKTYRNQRPYEG